MFHCLILCTCFTSANLTLSLFDQVNNGSQSSRRTSTDGSPAEVHGMKPSKSDSFLLVQVRNTDMGANSPSSEDTPNKSVSTTSMIPEDDESIVVSGQASEDSLVKNTASILSVTENATTNGEVSSPAQEVLGVCVTSVRGS